MPRPTRLRFRFAFFGARKFDRFFACFLAQRRMRSDSPDSRFVFAPKARVPGRLVLVDDPHQVRHRLHHAANRGLVHALHDLVQPREAQALDHQLVLHRA